MVDVFPDSLSLSARVLLGLVFLVAGVSKARSRPAFESSLAQYGFLPAAARPLVASAVPAVELALAALLLVGVALPLMGAFAAGLLVLFTGASFAASRRGNATCGCFGSFGTIDVRHLALRNFALIAAGLALVATGSSVLTVEAAYGVGPALAIALAAAVVLLAWSRSLVMTTQRVQSTVPLATGELSRRGFIGRLAVLGAGSVAAAALGLRGASPAEAACYGCGTCVPQYYYIGCVGLCYAAFWQASFEYCEPDCLPCGSWQVVNLCCYEQCC